MSTTSITSFHWKCQNTWKQSSYNTMWCLVGCSIGDLGTIFFFQINNIFWPTMAIMILAIINGLITSIILETFILWQKMKIYNALKIALGMSFISMLSMEIVMNTADVIITGGAKLNIYVIPIMFVSGFLAAWPYNYWRLKKYKLSCH